MFIGLPFCRIGIKNVWKCTWNSSGLELVQHYFINHLNHWNAKWCSLGYRTSSKDHQWINWKTDIFPFVLLPIIGMAYDNNISAQLFFYCVGWSGITKCSYTFVVSKQQTHRGANYTVCLITGVSCYTVILQIRS